MDTLYNCSMLSKRNDLSTGEKWHNVRVEEAVQENELKTTKLRMRKVYKIGWIRFTFAINCMLFAYTFYIVYFVILLHINKQVLRLDCICVTGVFYYELYYVLIA